MKARKSALYTVIVCLLFGPSLAIGQDLLPRDNGIASYHNSPEYRDSESHPLRTIAWVLHPVGWVLREAIYRPLSSFTASTPFTRSFFGYRSPYDHRNSDCFSDSDVIPDCRAVAPMTKIGYSPNISSGGQASLRSSGDQVYFPDVAFEYDKATLNALGRGRVRQISQLLASVPNLNVVVEGHTDVRGSDKYNSALAEKRAQVVIQELSELGIDPARLSPVAKGKEQPIFADSEDWAHAVNRRVQFKVAGGA